MLARSQRQTIQHYTSDRVFDGTRPVSAARLAKLKASYQRTHTTVVYRWAKQVVTRIFGAKAAGC
jgi:hypothetical protein